MEKFLKNQQIPLTQVIDPNTGQAYYAPQNVVYDDKVDSGPTYLRDVIVDQATTASYFSGSITNAISASYALTASYVAGGIASASFATSASYALTSSFATRALSASYAVNGGVTQLLAGPNISLSPTNGLGQVTVSATLSGSTIFNTATGSYGSFYDTTTQTNPVANIARSMSLNSTDITNGVSVSGSTNPFNTYIKTENAGVYDIQFSAQVDKTDGGSDDIVIWLRKNGIDLTDTATTLTLPTNNSKVVAAWNWFVTSANGDYYQIIWRSADTDLRLLAEPISADHPGIPSVIVTANRVDQFLSNTGSFSGSFTGAFTGSFSGSIVSPGSDTQIIFNNGGVLGATGSFIYSGSRVGIGKSNPNATLDINGNTLTSGSSTWVSPGFTAGYISPGSDGISIGNNNSSVHIRIRNSNRTSFDQSCGFGGAGSFGMTTSDRITVLTGGTTSGQTGLWVGSSANFNIFKVQGDSRVGINLATATAALHVQGTGATSATTALLVQNANASSSFQIRDNGDSIFYYPGVAGYSLKISGSYSGNGTSAIYETLGGTGGYYGIHEFRTGTNVGSSTRTLSIIYGGRVVIGNKSNSDLQNPKGNLLVDTNFINTFSGADPTATAFNTGLIINPTGSIDTKITASGIQFNYYNQTNDINGGAFLGSQWNPLTNGYDSDLVVYATQGSAGTYNEIIRFVGKSKSVSIGAGRNPSASLHISGASSAALLEIDSPAVNNIVYVSGSGRVGLGTGTPITTLDVSGSGRFTNSLNITGSLSITGSAGTNSAIYAYKSGSTVLDIQGSQGQLFSVTDALSGSLMSVNDVSGLPILEVFSDDRVVMGTYGAPALTVTGSTLIATGSLLGTASYATQALSASYAPGGASFPYTGSAGITGSLDVVGDITITGSLFVSQSLDTFNRILYDSNAVQSIDWTTRALADSSKQTSVDWENRILYDINGNEVLRYDSPSNGYKIGSFTYYLSLLGSQIQEEFTNVPQDTSGEVNYEGEVIEGVLDGTVVTHDLVYLSSSGTWFPLTQGTDQCAKLLGICVQAPKNFILLEGSLTVTSNISATDSPFVQGIAAGLPIYIKDSSGTKMSTTSPTGSGQYARVLGHAYYNSTTYTDYWTMKFRPSNDWFQNN